MISKTLKALSVFTLTVFALQAQAGIGTLKSVKMCVDRGGKQDCKSTKMPSNKSCSVTSTSLSGTVGFQGNMANGLSGDSSFSGVFSIPAAGKQDKFFKGRIVEYTGDYVAGFVDSVSGAKGEFNGNRRLSAGNKYKVTIKNFYLYVRSGKSGSYTEYHCSL